MRQHFAIVEQSSQVLWLMAMTIDGACKTAFYQCLCIHGKIPFVSLSLTLEGFLHCFIGFFSSTYSTLLNKINLLTGMWNHFNFSGVHHQHLRGLLYSETVNFKNYNLKWNSIHFLLACECFTSRPIGLVLLLQNALAKRISPFTVAIREWKVSFNPQDVGFISHGSHLFSNKNICHTFPWNGLQKWRHTRNIPFQKMTLDVNISFQHCLLIGWCFLKTKTEQLNWFGDGRAWRPYRQESTALNRQQKKKWKFTEGCKFVERVAFSFDMKRKLCLTTLKWFLPKKKYFIIRQLVKIAHNPKYDEMLNSIAFNIYFPVKWLIPL